MLEIVQEILEAEQKAEEALQKAKAEADNIRIEADEKSNKILKDVREEVRRSNIEKLEEARRRSSSDAEHVLEQERTKSAAFLDQHAGEIESLVREIVDRIVQTDHTG